MDYDVPLTHERWQDHNRRGLAFAAAADWTEAADAFTVAAEALASDPEELTPHEPLALVLGNLAQACFRAGRLDEALGHAQRACALRVALTGEDGMPAARARMDLAVILATADRRDEAMTLVQRAIAAVERHVGEEDPRLTVVLENAARIALSTGAAASAEPFLLRLHALLALHDESTESADRLLARIAEVRTMQSGTPRAAVPVATPPGATPAVPREPMASAAVPAAPAASPVGDQSRELAADLSRRLPPDFPVDVEWEDQPLRDAVALTDVLLRTTPSGVPAIPGPEIVQAMPEIPEMSAATPDATPTAEPLVLDFAVHHGLIDEEYLEAPRAPITPTLELVDAIEPTEIREDREVEASVSGIVESVSEAAMPPSIVQPDVSMASVEATDMVVPGASPADAPPADIPAAPVPAPTSPSSQPQRSPRSVAVVLPTPHAGSAVETTPHAPRAPGSHDAAPSASRTPLLLLAGGLLAAGAAAGWWFFLR